MRLSLAILVVIAGASLAHAQSRFQVNPTSISLSRSAPAEAVVITNHGTRALRVQASVATWSENRDGAMVLGETKDVVVRPSLLEIEPGGSRTVRVGTTLGARAVEGTYRLFVEELPDRRTAEGGRIVVLTRMGVPVFLAPAKSTESVDVKASLGDKVAFVDATNTGTMHSKVAKVVVRAVAGSTVRWERTTTGWYVLPGTERRFVVELGTETCRAGEVVVADLVADTGTVWTSPPLPCR